MPWIFLKAGEQFADNKKKLDVYVSNPKTAPADSIYYYDLQWQLIFNKIKSRWTDADGIVE